MKFDKHNSQLAFIKPADYRKTIILMVIIMVIVGYCHFQGWQQDQRGNRQTEKLRKITPDQIKSIAVWEDTSCKKLVKAKDIGSKESNALFAKAMNELDGYYPSHDKRRKEYFIRMYDANGEKYEFDVWLKSLSDRTVYMHLVEWEGSSHGFHIAYLGGRKSKSLYAWFEYLNLI